MANGVWHTGYEIEINLSVPDLGHPDRPGLLAEITTSIAARSPRLLECLAHHDGKPCESEAGGKSPWMFIRRARVGGRYPLVASHLPVTHKPTPAETAQHKATKERIADIATRNGLEADTEVSFGPGRRRGVADAVVTGPGGERVGWEIQYSPLTSSGVHSRSVRARDSGLTPLWVAKDRRAALIDRAPWARVDDMPWKDIADGHQMLIRGGFRYLNVWRCTSRSVHHCLDSSGAGHCGRLHADWFIPVMSVPAKPTLHLEDLVISSAVKEFVAVFVPARAHSRAGRYMWVTATDRQLWEDLAGQPTPLPEAAPPDPDDTITFAENELDRTCRAGQDSDVRSDPLVPRDLAQPTGGITLPLIPSSPRGQRRSPAYLTDAERAAAAAAIGCPPWELGPCVNCTQLIRRYGRNAPMACPQCRSAHQRTR